MATYKVRFRDNVGISAELIMIDKHTDVANLAGVGGDEPIILWLIVDAENEKDAIATANTAVKKNWSGLFNTV